MQGEIQQGNQEQRGLTPPPAGVEDLLKPTSDLAPAVVPPVRVSLADQIRSRLQELLPPKALEGVHARHYAGVLKEAQGYLESSAEEWLSQRTQAAAIDLLPRHCSKEFRSLFEQAAAKQPLADLRDSSLKAAAAQANDRLFERAAEWVKSLKELIGQQIARRSAIQAERSAAADFCVSAAVDVSQAFEKHRKSLPAELRAELEQSHKSFRPAGWWSQLLCGLGLVKVDDLWQQHIKRLTQSWIEKRSEEDAQCARLVTDAELEKVELAKKLENPSEFLAQTYREGLIASLNRRMEELRFDSPIETVQELGRMLQVFRADSSILEEVLYGLCDINECLAPQSSRFVKQLESFARICDQAFESSAALEAASLVFSQVQGQCAAQATGATVMDLLPKMEKALAAENAAKQQERDARGCLENSILDTGRMLYMEAKRLVLRNQEAARSQVIDAARALSNHFIPFFDIPGSISAASSVTKVNREGSDLVERACHRAINDWISAEAGEAVETYLLQRQIEASKFPGERSSVKRPAVIDGQVLNDWIKNGGSATVFFTEFGTSMYCTTGEGVNEAPKKILASIRDKWFDHRVVAECFKGKLAWPLIWPRVYFGQDSWEVYCRGVTKGLLWLPLRGEVDKAALETALGAFAQRSQFRMDWKNSCDEFALWAVVEAKLEFSKSRGGDLK